MYRLWYPQLDAYDAVRRMALILLNTHGLPITRNRLYIYDFYLSNPPLLHKARMTTEVRKIFTSLAIPRPEAGFLQYPPAPLLFQKMSGMQRTAFHNLIGRKLIDIEKVKSDEVLLSTQGKSFAIDVSNLTMEVREVSVLKFLCNDFASLNVDEAGGLRAATGLRRIGQ